MNERLDPNETIQASEIAEYLYCNKQWWMKRVHGIQSSHVRRMERGTAYHNQHSRWVGRAVRNERLIYGCVFLATLLIGYAVINYLG